MAPICGPQTATIGYVDSLVCSKLVRISDIKPTHPDQADLIIDGYLISAYKSGSAHIMDSEIWTLYLLSKTASSVTISLTISPNPCQVECPDQCVGGDLYTSNCFPDYDPDLLPIGSHCEKGVLKQAGSPACVAATHYVSLSMGFVPPELITYFETYISAISDNLMTYMVPFPSPWVYLKTTYERAENAFRIWLYLPPTATASVMVMTWVDDMLNFLSTWVPIVVGIIAAIIGGAIIVAGAIIGGLTVVGTIVALGLLIGGVAILYWKIHEIVTARDIAEETAKNGAIQINIFTNFDATKDNINKAWEASKKTLADCTTRLEGYRDMYLASVIDSYIDKYAKYAAFITELQAERAAFLTTANAIIAEFKTKPYTVDVCNTYYASLDGAITASKVKVNDSVAKNIDPTKTYETTCKGWTNQAACEKAECHWYNSSCNLEEQCWIANPLGGCILSASTGKTIVGVTVGLALLGAVYWLLTRKREEVISIYAGAKEAAGAEAARAKAAYRGIRAPAVPRGAPG